MLKDLIPQYSTIHIADREYHVRYSLNALLCLEMTYKPLSEILQTEWQNWNIEDVLQLCHAAMCGRPCNRKAVNARNFHAVKPTLAELGEIISMEELPKLRLEIISAIINSMPESSPDDKPSDKSANEGHQRAVYVDIIGRPEHEYWNSTNREITNRINCYLEAKGLKDTPTQVQAFDE